MGQGGQRAAGGSKRSRDPNALFQQAASAFAAGRLADAERDCRQLLAMLPDHAAILHLQGAIVWRRGRAAEAKAILARALAQNPQDADARNTLGCILVELGETEDALAAFDAALKVRPDYADALANRARALLALDRPEEALASSRAAVALRPDFFDAWTHLGNAALRVGQVREATQAFDRAIALQPDHPGAHLNLARALVERGDALRAEAEFRYALKLAPGNLEAHLGLGEILNRAGSHAQALAVFEEAGRIAPDNLDVRLGFARSLFFSGQSEAAASAYAAAQVAQPQAPRVYLERGSVYWAAGRKDEAIADLKMALQLDRNQIRALATLIEFVEPPSDDPLIKRATDLLDGNAVKDVEDQIDLCFAIGKVLMKEDDPARAFAYLDRGNRLKRARFDFDVGQAERQMAEIARQFTPQLFERLAGAGAPSDLPVFIVGMPRSGTTLVEQILAAHPEVRGAGELYAMDRATRSLPPPGYPAVINQVDRDQIAGIGRSYLAEVEPMAQGRKRLVDKLPANFVLAGLIALALPQARIIHLRRDAVDTCLSCYSILFADAQPFTYDQAELGRYWRAYDALMAHWRSVLPTERFMEVQYEDVVADLENQARRLVDFVGLPWTDACLAFHTVERLVSTASVAQVRRPIYKQSVGRWVRYAPYLRPLLQALGVEIPMGAGQNT